MKKLILVAWILSAVPGTSLVQADPSTVTKAGKPGQEVSDEDRQLAAKFLQAGPPPCCDRPEPYSEEVAARPQLAPVLARALKEASPEIREKRVSIIYMLGRMGNPEAFRELAALYDAAQPPAARIRLMISLGACVTGETLAQYLDIALKDPDVLAWLQNTSGASCGADKACWQEFFIAAEEKALREFNERCRQASRPILG